MFVIDFNKIWDINSLNNKEDFVKQNEQYLRQLFLFFTPGKLYLNLVDTPAYLSKQKLLDKRWEWLKRSYDIYNNQIPVMFINTITNDNYHQYYHLSNSYKSLTKSVCLQFLYGSNSIYVPVVPGKENLIFQPYI